MAEEGADVAQVNLEAIFRGYASEAAAAFSETGERAWQVAAEKLRDLANDAARKARSEREKKQRQRAAHRVARCEHTAIVTEPHALGDGTTGRIEHCTECDARRWPDGPWHAPYK